MDPSQFLDVAMRTPMIADLDLAMVEPVVSALAAQPSAAFIAVNVTGLTLARTDYASYVSACLAQHDVSPSRLHVEITETMLLGLDDDVVAQITAWPAWACGGTSTTSAPGTRRSATCATCRCRA